MFGGCFGSGEGSCEYWLSTLEKGKKEKDAVEKVAELNCQGAIPILHERYPESLYRREILIALKRLNEGKETIDEKSIEVVRWALPDKEVGPLAIQMAIEWRVSSIKEDISALIRKQRHASTRRQAVEALVELISPPNLTIGEGDSAITYTGRPGRSTTYVYVQYIPLENEEYKELLPGVHIIEASTIGIKADYAKGVTATEVAALIAAHEEAPYIVKLEVGGDGTGKVLAMEKPKLLTRIISDTTLIGTLTWVCGQEPTLQGVDTNQYAADRLREVNWKETDETLALAAAQNLVKALFMRDAKGNSAQINARFALRTIGSPAVDPILKAFQGVNEDLNEFAQIRGLPKWRYTQGPELVEMLWDVGDSRATPALMEAIGIPLDPPPPDVARLAEADRAEWKMTNSNRLTTTALTVGALPNDDAIRYAIALLGRKNPPPDATQFIQAGLGLALMGTPKSREALWQLFGEGGDLNAKREELAVLRKRIEGMSGDNPEKRELMAAHDTLYDDIQRMESTRANYITNLAVGLGPKEVGDFKTQILDIGKGPIFESASQPLPKGYYAAVAQCGAKIACYAKMIEDQAGKLSELPLAAMKAQTELGDAKTAIREELKPVGERIRAQEGLIKAKYEAMMAVKATIDEIDGLEKAAREARNDERNTKVDEFNTGLEEYEALRAALAEIHKERNAIIEKLDPFKEAFAKQMEAIHAMEKAALMLGGLEGGAQYVPMLTKVFHEGGQKCDDKGSCQTAYTQFRQWTLITLEHNSNKSHLDVLRELLRLELGPDEKDTFWTLRLQSLIERVERR